MASGRVKETTLGTSQGNLGLKGHANDHSTGGCTVIALLIVSACLVNIASAFIIEKIIDVFCQKPLSHIRSVFYFNMGFDHVTSEEGVNELCDLGLFGRPDVSSHLLFTPEFLFLLISIFFKHRNFSQGKQADLFPTHSLGIF